LVAAARWRLLDVPLERDEGEYAYAGQLLLQGVPPYQLAYNMKLPGTYAMYAGFLALFGPTARGVHLGLLLVNLASIVLLFRLAQRLFGSTAAVVAAAAYGLLSLQRETLGLFAHATHMIVLWVLAGSLGLLAAQESGRRRDWFASGVLLGVAVLMKQHAVFFVPLGVIAMVVAVRQWPARRARLPGDGLAFVGGVALPPALTFLALAAAGVLGTAWFWVVRYAAAYVSEVPPAQGWENLRRFFVPILRTAPLLWGLAAAGLVVLALGRPPRGRRWMPVSLLLLAALAAAPGLHFRPHYFIVMLPAVALLAGVAMAGAHRALRTIAPGGVAGAIVALVSLGILGVSFLPQADLLLRTPPARVARIVYGAEPFPEAVEVARYIRAHSSPDERIVVLGSEPEIYFYAGRRSATGFLYVNSLMENQPYAPAMQRRFVREVEAGAPAWMVNVGVASSWGVQADSDNAVFEWASRYLGAHYVPVGVVEIESAERTVYRWRDGTPLEEPRAPFWLVVYRRNPGA
jgi:MFS family permease